MKEKIQTKRDEVQNPLQKRLHMEFIADERWNDSRRNLEGQ